MNNQIVNFIINLFPNTNDVLIKQLIVFIISLMPIMELRGGLLAASILHLNPVASYIICFIGNIIPVPFILWFINKILNYLRTKKKAKKLMNFLDRKIEKHQNFIKKYGYLGLVLFVAIPIPGTGAWTGCLIASVLNMDKKKSFFATLLGVFIASIIMMIISFGLVSNII